MDNNIPNSTEENPLAALLSNPEILSRLSGVLDSLKAGAPPAPEATEASATPEPPPAPDSTPAPSADSTPAPSADSLSAVLSNPELMAKLPDVMTALTPVLKGSTPKKAPPDRRTALLLALRPYLSQGRCEAIDYITRIGKLGDVVKNLKL